jgi:hypothetical protein
LQQPTSVPTNSPVTTVVASDDDGINILGIVAGGLVSLVALCAAGICFYAFRARRRPHAIDTTRQSTPVQEATAKIAIPSGWDKQIMHNAASSSAPATPASAAASSGILPATEKSSEEDYDI